MFATEGALPQGSGVLKKLRSFLGMPRGSSDRLAREPFVIPRLGRPFGSKGLGAGRNSARATRGSASRKPPRPPAGTRFREQLEILGLDVECSLGDVKRRFRELAKELHPDLLIHKSRDQQAEASKRFLLVKNAYETIRRGWKEEP